LITKKGTIPGTIESKPLVFAEVDVAPDHEIVWENIPTGPDEPFRRTVARTLYRSLPNSDELRAIAVLRDNTTTTYVDRTPDEELPDNREPRMETNLDPIAKCRFLVRHPNSYRLFAAGNPEDPAAVYFSEPNAPDYWKPTSVLYPTTGDGPVQNIIAFGDALLVFYKHSVWAWRGIDPDE